MIADSLTEDTPFLDGEIEVDESTFGGRRKGKRGRGAAGKVPVFGLLKRGGKVHAVMVPDAKSKTLLGIMRQRILPDSVVYTDCFGSYDVRRPKPHQRDRELLEPGETPYRWIQRHPESPLSPFS